MKIVDILATQAIIPDMGASTKDEVLEELAQKITSVDGNEPMDSQTVGQILKNREELGSTGIGDGIAIPHGRIPGLSRMHAALGVSRQGVDFGALDGNPSHLFFLLLAPEDSAGEHLKALARICRLFKGTELVEELIGPFSAEEIFQKIAQEDNLL